MADFASIVTSIDAALAQFACDGAQSISIDGKTYTRAQVNDLLQLRDWAQRQQVSQSSGGMRVGVVSFGEPS